MQNYSLLINQMNIKFVIPSFQNLEEYSKLLKRI